MKPMTVLSLLSFLAASFLQAKEKLDIGSADLSQLEVVSNLDDFKPTENEFRIYYIGDSITMHGFNNDTVERLKWDHLAGMAASSEAKDYAHLLADAIRPLVAGKKVRLFFGPGGNPVTALAGIANAITYQPALVVVQLGEHVEPQDSAEKIEADYAALLAAIQGLKHPPLVIATGVWNPQKGKDRYTDRTALIEETQARACKEKRFRSPRLKNMRSTRRAAEVAGLAECNGIPTTPDKPVMPKSFCAALRRSTSLEACNTNSEWSSDSRFQFPLEGSFQIGE